MNGKKILTAVTLAALVSTVSAAPKDIGNDWKNSVRVGDCSMDSRPVLETTQSIEDDTDTGPNGPWANLNYTQNIKVWELGEEKYCAVVEHEGEFKAIEEMRSPGNGEELTGNEEGEMQGGYRVIIEGTQMQEDSSDSSLPGDTLRSVNHDCGTTSSSCQEDNSWMESYFGQDREVEYEWWAWTYNAGKCGSWTNSQSGNSGDVHCE